MTLSKQERQLRKVHWAALLGIERSSELMEGDKNPSYPLIA